MKYERIITFRARCKDMNLIKEICKSRGEDVSDFIRRSIRKELARMSYLSDKEKKALEIEDSRGEINDRD